MFSTTLACAQKNISSQELAELLLQYEDDEERKMKVFAMRLFSNVLTYVPDAVFSFVMVRKLELSANKLAALSPLVGNLVHLGHLYLNNNELETVPAELARCTQLQDLYLANNRLRFLPDLRACSKLKLLWLDGNSFEPPLPGPPRTRVLAVTQARLVKLASHFQVDPACRRAVLCFLWAAPRLQLSRDVARLIAKRIWQQRQQDSLLWVDTSNNL